MRKYIRGRGWVAAVILVLMSSAGALADQIDDYVRDQMRQNDIPGLSLAVLKHGHVEKMAAYGLANIELKVPATKDTAYEIGSVTKQFTASAVLLLSDEGHLRLDYKLKKYVRDIPAAWEAVTLRQLLTHTSGIRNYQEADAYSITTNYSFRDLVKLSASLPVSSAPGEKWIYSNTGYVLLGAIIEPVTGRSYAAFVQDRFFIPLQMSNTRMNDRRAVIPGRASGYGREFGRWSNVPPQPIATPAGGIISTVVDMAKWDAALNTDFPTKRPIHQQLWTRAKDARGNETPYGMGWFVTSIGGHSVVEHSGATPGFRSAVIRVLDNQVSVIVLTNSDNEVTEQIARTIALGLQNSIAADGRRAPGNDTQKIKGTWLVVSAETGGRPLPQEQIQMASITFSADRVVFKNLMSGKGEGTYELRPADKPGAINLLIAGNEDIQGIYELDQDHLKLCLGSGGKSRPTEYSGKGDQMLLLLRREKSGQPAH
jgi:uncharacterized protein (TIGR03067 family)